MVVVPDRDIIISLSPHQTTNKCQIKRVTTTSHLRTTANKAAVVRRANNYRHTERNSNIDTFMFKVMIPVIVVPAAAAAEAVEVEAAAHGTTEEAIPTGMLFTFIH